MTVISWEEFVNQKATRKPSVAAIGVFDGVHLGHQQLFATMKALHPDYRRIAVTFKINPKKIMRPESFGGDICSLEQKLELLAASGLDLCVLIDFSPNFSKMSGEDFVRLLVDCGDVRSFVVGWNFAFGNSLHLKADNLPEVASHFGAIAELVDPVYLDSQPVSSSLIRSCLMKGLTDQALAMLGHPYTLDLRNYKIVSTGNEHCAKPAETKVLPLKMGMYLAELSAKEGMIPVQLRVGSDQTVCWHHDSQEAPASIVFYQYTENTDSSTVV